MATAVLVRVPWQAQPLYAQVTGMVTREYVDIVISAEHGIPGWPKGSRHVVPTWRVSTRQPRHKRRWWRR